MRMPVGFEIEDVRADEILKAHTALLSGALDGRDMQIVDAALSYLRRLVEAQ